MMKFFKTLAIFTLLSMGLSHACAEEVPVTTDARIKTFVYNENEVFHLMIHYGYQSNIEFAVGEEIETISLGDSYLWKLTPVGRRLFIKPMETNVRTNMTIVTNKRTYQFDVIAKTPDDALDNELVYVVRFFYPDKKLDAVAAAELGAAAVMPPRFPAPQPMVAPQQPIGGAAPFGPASSKEEVGK